MKKDLILPVFLVVMFMFSVIIYFLSNKFSSLSTILFESKNKSYSILKRKLAESNFDISKPVKINDIENNFKRTKKGENVKKNYRAHIL